jgi:two-component system LytT family sensor kinase
MVNGRFKITLNVPLVIAFSLSLALAIFYSLPWIALGEHTRIVNTNPQQIREGRGLYLFLSVFLTSILFFQYNLFWKNKVAGRDRMIRRFIHVMFNMLLIVIISGVLIILASRIFSIGEARALFIFYVFRNTSIMLVVLLVTHVIELVDKSRSDKIKILTLQHQNSETELSALRSQIDPHFLFNSLTSLSSLIRANSKEALEFVNHLSDTFRYILEKREHNTVTVKDELHFIESYIFMLRTRFADGFQIIMNINEEHLNRNIPQFALQVMIENAIKHNLVSAKNPLRIEIHSLGNDLCVRNNLQTKNIISGYRIGLSNLSKRYHLICGKNIAILKTADYFEVRLPLL